MTNSDKPQFTPGPWDFVPASSATPPAFILVFGDFRTGWAHEPLSVEQRAINMRLAAAAPEMHAALIDVQWANGGFCPQCAQGPVKGHQPNCLIGVALAKAVKT